MITTSKKTCLDIYSFKLNDLLFFEYIRFYFVGIIERVLEKTNSLVFLYEPESLRDLVDFEVFVKSIQDKPHIYKASLSRQLSADLSPDVEETTFKETAKSWYIKTADFGDKYDQLLQHPDGRYTQLLEDIACYHQIFQQGYDKIILLRPPIYTGYDIQLTAAMQCLGYTKEQFQFLIVQPLKLYAFHEPSQKLHAIPDISTEELIKAIGMDALRWHSFSAPLAEIAPINISTAGQPTPQDSLYRVQAAHVRCCALLQAAHQRGIVGLNILQRGNWQISPAPIPLSEYVWDNSLAEKLASLVQAVPEILQQSAAEVAPHLLVRHLEAMGNACHQWCNTLTEFGSPSSTSTARVAERTTLTKQDCALLLATQQTLFDLLENIFAISAPDLVS